MQLLEGLKNLLMCSNNGQCLLIEFSVLLIQYVIVGLKDNPVQYLSD